VHLQNSSQQVMFKEKKMLKMFLQSLYQYTHMNNKFQYKVNYIKRIKIRITDKNIFFYYSHEEFLHT